jgi:hypothetical protein
MRSCYTLNDIPILSKLQNWLGATCAIAPLGLEAAADADCEVEEEGLDGCGPDEMGTPAEC